MKRYVGILVIATLAACQVGAGPATLADVESAYDWHNDPGKSLNAHFERDTKRLLKGRTRDDAIESLTAAGYECVFGEASAEYPEPAAQCTNGFATRACQMDWEILLASTNSRVDSVSSAFKRDCVGRKGDWPEAVDSAIDDQLAPPPQ